MRKMILFFVLVILCFLGYSEGNRVMTVSIKLILSPLYGGGEIEIYNDSYSRIAEVWIKLRMQERLIKNL